MGILIYPFPITYPKYIGSVLDKSKLPTLDRGAYSLKTDKIDDLLSGKQPTKKVTKSNEKNKSLDYYS